MNTTPYSQEDSSGYADAVYPFHALPASATEPQHKAHLHDPTDEIPVMKLQTVLMAAMLLAGTLGVIVWLFL